MQTSMLSISKQVSVPLLINPQSLWELNSELQLLEGKAKAFSLFKMGYKKQVVAMAREFVKGFGVSKTDILVGSPYMNITNSAGLLAKIVADISGAGHIRCHRHIAHNQPYNKITAEERLKLIERDELAIDDKFYTPTFQRQLATCERIIFVDDCIITGYHQKMVENKIILANPLLAKYQHKIKFLYLYANKGLAPDIEHKLNNAANITKLALAKDLLWEQHSKVYFNSRNIKAVLALPFDDFAVIVEKANPIRLATFKMLALANNYDQFYSNLLHLS
jgi:hypothetical protein